MNVGMLACLTLGIFFLIFSICFAILKEKGAILVSGFNSFSKAEREKYEKKNKPRYEELFFPMGNDFIYRGTLLLFCKLLLCNPSLYYLANSLLQRCPY